MLSLLVLFIYIQSRKDNLGVSCTMRQVMRRCISMRLVPPQTWQLQSQLGIPPRSADISKIRFRLHQVIP